MVPPGKQQKAGRQQGFHRFLVTPDQDAHQLLPEPRQLGRGQVFEQAVHQQDWEEPAADIPRREDESQYMHGFRLVADKPQPGEAAEQAKQKISLVQSAGRDHEVVQVQFLLQIVLDEILRTLDTEYPLPPADLLERHQQQHREQPEIENGVQRYPCGSEQPGHPQCDQRRDQIEEELHLFEQLVFLHQLEIELGLIDFHLPEKHQR